MEWECPDCGLPLNVHVTEDPLGERKVLSICGHCVCMMWVDLEERTATKLTSQEERELPPKVQQYRKVAVKIAEELNRRKP